MSKLSYADLKKMGAEKRDMVSGQAKKTDHPIVLVGTGSCGVAAGAKETIAAIRDQIEKSEVDAEVKETGCMGLCYSEPTVEVVMPDMPTVIYGKVDEKVARTIVREHVMEKRLLEDHIYDRPAPDIVEEG